MRRLWLACAVLVLVLIQEQQCFVGAEAAGGFVTARGTQLMLNGGPFRANGFNAYWLMLIASDPSQRPKVSSALQAATRNRLAIGRTWAFSDGSSSTPLQSSPGVYNEQMFQGLDFVVAEAAKYGVKLILSLVNNYDDFGGKKQYVEWARNQGQSISSDDGFYTNPVVKEFYKNHIKTVLTRVNTVTKVAYKDEPTIMAWELMNEPRCPSDPSGKTLQEWIAEMGSYLKSIDAKHLLEVGLEGFYGQGQQQNNPNSMQLGTDFLTNNQIASIDFATVHSYPDQWLPNNPSNEAQLQFLKHWIKVHIEDAQQALKKPVMLAEFGKSWKTPGFSVAARDEVYTTVYSAIYASAKGGGPAVGGLFWQLLSEGLDSYGDGYQIVLTQNSSTVDIIAEEGQKLQNIRKMLARLRHGEKHRKRHRTIRHGH